MKKKKNMKNENKNKNKNERKKTQEEEEEEKGAQEGASLSYCLLCAVNMPHKAQRDKNKADDDDEPPLSLSLSHPGSLH